ncbi:hypothetical protein [Thermomonas sp. S9]|uniref:cyanophycin synthetase family protein n=1 Tax=Thermomonas sp. S9 TaxID=2885203 RepID=UPI0028703904|nr:hypothetical protein [Thermomonas sp. S9]
MCAAPTSGPTARCWKPGWTSAVSRTIPPTASTGSPSACWPGCRGCRSTVAAWARRAASCSACARAPGRRTSSEHITLELQTQVGMQTGFGKAREAGPRGLYKVAVRSRDEQVSRACLLLARDLLMAAINDTGFDLPARLPPLRELADRRLLGPSTAAIVEAAGERGIPHLGLTDGNLVQLGYGRRQRRIWTAETERTSAIAEASRATRTSPRPCWPAAACRCRKGGWWRTPRTPGRRRRRSACRWW